ncbi:Aromatic-amino-acid aminotransferase 1 [Trichoplax sp. H2]|nr:Aromatic-amino-acid aminotransferase 1 [Trichoplax sp. H2]|eukprot:RDD45396.1 Aromatic-amino-acid aminotransferase 1 [Trichoplax sp. H2]
MESTYYQENGYFSDGLLNFSVGTIGPKLLKDCKPIIQKATDIKLSEENCSGLFQYGPTCGDRYLRKELATFLEERYGDHVDRDDLICTAGATNGLITICNLLFTAGDYIFIGDVSYYSNIMYMKHLQYNMVTVPMDDNGMIIDKLEEKIRSIGSSLTKSDDSDKPYSAMVYIIPTFQNPTGRCLSEDRCRQLVQLARRHKLLVFADDVANLVYHGDEKYPPRRLFSYDCREDADFYGNVISNSSFSKVFCPGICKGWMETPKRIIDMLELYSPVSCGYNHYMDGIMEVQKRKLAIKDALIKYMPDFVVYEIPEGGYFIWIDLHVNAEEILKMCTEQHRIAFFPASRVALSGGYETQIRFSVSYYEEDILTNAIRKIADVVKNYNQN